MGSHTMQQLKIYTFDELKELFETTMKHVSTFTSIETEDKERESELVARSSKRPRAEHDEESVKKQKLEENEAEKRRLELTHIMTENMMYYQIIRVDRSSKNYKIFSEMLDDFDRQDVVDLHRLVQERYETTSPEGYDLLLWGDLKTLFEPCEEDEVWRNQQGYNLISWRLFDSCGVHVLLMDNGIAIHMMIEKKYPLTQEMLLRMINRRLEVDHESEMAFELLRFTRSQLKKKKRIDQSRWTITSRLKPETITDIYIYPKSKRVIIIVYRGNDQRNFDIHNPFKFGDFGVIELDESGPIIQKKKNKMVGELMTSLGKRYERLKKIPEELRITPTLPTPGQVLSLTLGRKRKIQELEPKTRIPVLECNISLPKGIPFVNNLVIEQPEYGMFFIDVFGDEAFQRMSDIHKVDVETLLTYLVMASNISTPANQRFCLELRSLIDSHPDKEKLKSKKVKLKAVGYSLD
ncbi:hypothetical protein Tco_1227745 [Tanacetum coccineum]